METIVRPDITRVVLTGSESVGKTTLAGQLAGHYGVTAVAEFARSYAATLGRPLGIGDAEAIARGQMANEDACMTLAAGLLIQDTDLVSTVVYSRHYYGQCPLFVEDAASARRAELYLLLDIDVPWVADNVRDRGDRRAEVQQLFTTTLQQLNAPYTTIQGNWQTRFARAVAAIDHALAARAPVRTDTE